MALPVRINIKVSSDWSGGSALTYASGAQSATAGNTLIICAGGNATVGQSISGITDTAGNTYVRAEYSIGPDSYREEIWYAKNILGNAANDVTVTWTGSVGYRAVVVLQYSGLSLTTPLVTFAKGTAAASSTTVTTSTFTTGGFDEVRILLPRWGLYTVDTLTYPTGFVELSSGTNTLVGELITSALITGGTYTLTHTNTSNQKQVLLAVFTSGVLTVTPEIRASQDVVEIISSPVPTIRVSHDVIETLSFPNQPTRISQYVVELLSANVAAPVSTESTQFLVIMP